MISAETKDWERGYIDDVPTLSKLSAETFEISSIKIKISRFVEHLGTNKLQLLFEASDVETDSKWQWKYWCPRTRAAVQNAEESSECRMTIYTT